MPTSSERTAGLRRAIRALGLILGLGSLSGCGVEQVAPAHRDLVLQLATATSTRDPKLLETVVAEVGRLEGAKELSDGERRAFREILDAAGAGEWDRARDLAYALRDGQEPTAEDRERVAKRTLRDPKPPPGKAGRNSRTAPSP